MRHSLEARISDVIVRCGWAIRCISIPLIITVNMIRYLLLGFLAHYLECVVEQPLPMRVPAMSALLRNNLCAPTAVYWGWSLAVVMGLTITLSVLLIPRRLALQFDYGPSIRGLGEACRHRRTYVLVCLGLIVLVLYWLLTSMLLPMPQAWVHTIYPMARIEFSLLFLWSLLWYADLSCRSSRQTLGAWCVFTLLTALHGLFLGLVPWAMA